MDCWNGITPSVHCSSSNILISLTHPLTKFHFRQKLSSRTHQVKSPKPGTTLIRALKSTTVLKVGLARNPPKSVLGLPTCISSGRYQVSPQSRTSHPSPWIFPTWWTHKRAIKILVPTLLSVQTMLM